MWASDAKSNKTNELLPVSTHGTLRQRASVSDTGRAALDFKSSCFEEPWLNHTSYALLSVERRCHCGSVVAGRAGWDTHKSLSTTAWKKCWRSTTHCTRDMRFNASLVHRSEKPSDETVRSDSFFWTMSSRKTTASSVSASALFVHVQMWELWQSNGGSQVFLFIHFTKIKSHVVYFIKGD